MSTLKYILLLTIILTATSCGIYSFTGADTGDAKTFQVSYFQNNAVLVEPGLDRDFTLTLQDIIQNQTNLNLVKNNGDLVYEGEITDYRIAPTTATADSKAAQNRLTINVKVLFTNKKKEENSFDKNFSFFYDYAGSAVLTGSQRETAWTEILERLTQDVFNASLANW